MAISVIFDDLARDGIPYVPYPPMQVALAWLLQRAPNALLIPGTSSMAHLLEKPRGGRSLLPDEALFALDGIARTVGSA